MISEGVKLTAEDYWRSSLRNRLGLAISIPMVMLDVQKGRITGHDVIGVGGKLRLQELVIIRIAANGALKRRPVQALPSLKLNHFEYLNSAQGANAVPQFHPRLGGYFSKMGGDIVKAKALFLPYFQNFKWWAFQKTPETKTLVSRIALIFTSRGA